MKYFKNIIALFIFVALSSNAYAGFILNGNINLGLLNLNEDFTVFYNYNNDVKDSSFTGFEEKDSIVLFLAEYNGDVALFSHIDASGKVNDFSAGSINFSLTDDSNVNNFVFIDDPNDPVRVFGNTTNIVFKYASEKNDGFIYSIQKDVDTFVSLLFETIAESYDVVFLSFDNAESRTLLVTGEEFNITYEEIPEPQGLFIMGIMTVLICATRRRQ